MGRISVVSTAFLVPLAAVALTGCGTQAAAGSSHHVVFHDKHEAAATGSRSVPAWVPDDAIDIVIDMPGSQPGYLMKFTSDTGLGPSTSCVAIAGDPPLEPTISANWWPTTALTDDRLRCGGTTQLARDGHEWYAWVTQ